MTFMSTTADSIATARERERKARDAKIEALLPAFEAHVSAMLGGLTINPHTEADARLLHAVAMRSMIGVPPVRSTRVLDRELLPAMWHTIADRAELPASRHPSCTTVEALVDRLALRVEDLRTATTDQVFDMAAGAA